VLGADHCSESLRLLTRTNGRHRTAREPSTVIRNSAASFSDARSYSEAGAPHAATPWRHAPIDMREIVNNRAPLDSVAGRR